MGKIIEFHAPEIKYMINILDPNEPGKVYIQKLESPWTWCVFILCSSFDDLPALKALGDQMVKADMRKAV